MADRSPFAIVYDREVHEHLRAIDKRFHGLIRAAIESQLAREPERETRNRKPLRRPVAFGAKWELRFGPANRFRVFYQVDGNRREVRILAIGTKERDRVIVGGEEIVL